MMSWVMLFGGGMLLYFGAEWFVGGASALARGLKVPNILVGLTVVAYGTSAPEVIVGVQSAATGHGDVAIGNVVGSNIANIGLILGVSALVRPARVDGSLRARELPVLLASAILLPLLLLDGRVSRWEGAALLVGAVVYTARMVASARSASALARAREEAEVTSEASDMAGAPRPGGLYRSVATTLVGLVVLLVGGRLFVDGAVLVARALGVSDRVVGLTVVAVGTSLPELVTSVIAASRGHSDIAVGNVVGSNIFNVLLCLGASALAGAVGAGPGQGRLDLVVMVLMTLLLVAFIRSERVISRREGAFALAGYVVFIALVVADV
jgi:cation:H+ antiporter